MKSFNAAFAAGLVILLFAGLVNAGLAYSEGKGSSSVPFKGSPPVAFGSWPKYPYLPCNKESIQTKASETYLACSEQANVTFPATKIKINVITHVGVNVKVACYYDGNLVSGWPKIVRWNYPIHCSAGGRLVSLDHKGPVLFWRHVSNPKDYMGFVFEIMDEGSDSGRESVAKEPVSVGDVSSLPAAGLNEASTGVASGVSAGVESAAVTQPAKKAFVKKTAVKKAKPAKKVSASKRVRKIRVKKALRKPPVKRVYRVKALRKRR